MKKLLTAFLTLAISGTFCTATFAKNCDVTFDSKLINKTHSVDGKQNLVIVKVVFTLTDTDGTVRTIVIDQKHKTKTLALDNCRVKSLIAEGYARDTRSKSAHLVAFGKASYCPGNPCNPLFRVKHTVSYTYPLLFNGFWHPLKT